MRPFQMLTSLRAKTRYIIDRTCAKINENYFKFYEALWEKSKIEQFGWVGGVFLSFVLPNTFIILIGRETEMMVSTHLKFENSFT